MNSRIRTIALMYTAAGALHQSPRVKSNYNPDRFKNYCSIVVERLAKEGLCYIEHKFFEKLYQVLPGKLRGQVLFHCDLKNRGIFITYKKIGDL